MIDYYAILGVTSSATGQEIRAAFHALAKENHPDHYPGDREKERRFKEAAAAYDVLSNIEERSRYDLERLVEELRAGSRDKWGPSPKVPSAQSARPVTPSPPSPPPPPVPFIDVPPMSAASSGPSVWLGILGVLGAVAFAAHAVEQRRTRWDPNVGRRRGRDGRFKPDDSLF